MSCIPFQKLIYKPVIWNKIFQRLVVSMANWLSSLSTKTCSGIYNTPEGRMMLILYCLILALTIFRVLSQDASVVTKESPILPLIASPPTDRDGKKKSHLKGVYFSWVVRRKPLQDWHCLWVKGSDICLVMSSCWDLSGAFQSIHADSLPKPPCREGTDQLSCFFSSLCDEILPPKWLPGGRAYLTVQGALWQGCQNLKWFLTLIHSEETRLNACCCSNPFLCSVWNPSQEMSACTVGGSSGLK